ncbi:MAG: DUF5686 and carboxypeptidase regulatory-like domain-containing protein [Tannerella sp.]|jgi:hypothetical protein|nr:DUF5686 and carboxypeptidase regulatory-like domain-containing protein [Tannerella sp.]
MKQNKCLYILFISWLLLCCRTNLSAQQRIEAEGTVRDSITGEALPYVSLYLKGTSIGTITNEDGSFSLKAYSDSSTLVIKYLGYEDYALSLKTGAVNRMHVLLRPVSYELADIEVRPQRERYARRNPAVDFIRNVIERRSLNDPRNHDYFSYQTYEQKSFAQNNFDAGTVRNSKLLKRFDFLLEYVDTSAVTGKPVLPLFNEEIIENTYYRKSPRSEKRVVEGFNRAGLVEIISEDGMTQLLEEVFKEVDIFQDNIPLFLNRFVSPISSFGPNFYKYYILDTLVLGGERCLDLGFVPFNSESFGFTGHLFVTLDSTFFVKKAQLNVPKDINLNYVSYMSIEQDFDRTDDDTRLVTKNEIVVELKILEKQSGLYARRVCLHRNHSFDPPENMDIFKQDAPVTELEEARKQPEIYWHERRIKEKDISVTSVDKMMKHLRRIPAFYWSEKVLGALINGYVQTAETNSPFEFGPANTLFSGNTLEGARFRLGGTTTVNLSNRFFADGYVAYGTGDDKFKYDAILEYSFNDKKFFRKEYPFHYLRAEYKYDINQIGQHYMYTNPDNIFMMPKRRRNDLITYMQTMELSYYREHYNGWGYGATARHLTEWATKYVPFEKIGPDGTVAPADHYRSAQIEFKIRWAPNEKFYQSRNYRYPITLDAPIVTLSHVLSRKGVLGSDFNYNRTDIGLRKRFWMSPFGYIDIYAQGGKVWDRVPYPLLIIPNANLSYSIEPESYTLMDPMEFINDRYASWEVTYFMNGTILNRLPVVKYLQLREVVAFRGWYGDLSDRNNPEKNGAGLYRFPSNTYMMTEGPYMEFSFGLDNIFKVLRLDYVWRLSYKNHPHTPNHGLRMKMQFSF